jgi:hypothetical protein
MPKNEPKFTNKSPTYPTKTYSFSPTNAQNPQKVSGIGWQRAKLRCPVNTITLKGNLATYLSANWEISQRYAHDSEFHHRGALPHPRVTPHQLAASTIVKKILQNAKLDGLI